MTMSILMNYTKKHRDNYESELEKLLIHNDNKITYNFLEEAMRIKNNILDSLKQEYNNKISKVIITTLEKKLQEKINILEKIYNLNQNKNITLDEKLLEELIFNNFYQILNNLLNNVNNVDDKFINNIYQHKNNLINTYKQKYIYTNFEDYYKDNTYSKEFLNNYYETLKKIDFKLNKEIEKLKEIYKLNKNINKKIIPKNKKSILFEDLINKNHYNNFNNDCTNDGSCIINNKYF